MIEYQEVQGTIPPGEDGTLVVIVDEDTSRTRAIFVERRGEEVFVTTESDFDRVNVKLGFLSEIDHGVLPALLSRELGG